MSALREKQKYRSTLGQRFKLLVPRDRELLEENIKLKIGSLEAFENGFDDAGGEQGETQDTAEVGFVYGFGFGEIADRGMASGFQHVAPAMGADNGLDDGVVDATGGCDPWSGAGRCHHLFASPLAAQRDGDVHRHSATVFTQGGATVLTGMYGCGAGHAASCVEPPLVRNSLQRDVSPSTRRCRSIPSGCRSTRSTSNSTMRACS